MSAHLQTQDPRIQGKVNFAYHVIPWCWLYSHTSPLRKLEQQRMVSFLIHFYESPSTMVSFLNDGPIHVHVCIHTYIHTYIHICIFFICIYIYIYTYIYIYIYTETRVYSQCQQTVFFTFSKSKVVLNGMYGLSTSQEKNVRKQLFAYFPIHLLSSAPESHTRTAMEL